MLEAPLKLFNDLPNALLSIRLNLRLQTVEKAATNGPTLDNLLDALQGLKDGIRALLDACKARSITERQEAKAVRPAFKHGKAGLAHAEGGSWELT